MKYALNLVYRAAAIDEIYTLLENELDLTAEDLKSCGDAYYELKDPDIGFSELLDLRDNLNLTPTQEKLHERMQVLKNKMELLHTLIHDISDTNCTFPRYKTDLDDETPF